MGTVRMRRVSAEARSALCLALVVGLATCAQMQRDRHDVSLFSLDVGEIAGDESQEEEAAKQPADDAPPTAVDEQAGPVAALNQPIAAAAAAAGEASNETTPSTPVVLPPPIFGGTEGEMMFKVTAHLPAAQELGEDSTAFEHSEAEAEEEESAAQSVGDKAYESLFDLKPLFMGIQADVHRRRALLGGVCLMSLNDVVNEGVCKKGHQSEDGSCSMYSIPPMSVAMQALFKNAKTNFCKFNASDCDATLCYTYGGPVATTTGLQESTSHVMKNYPIWVHQTALSGNGTASKTDQVITQMISFKISLEKVVFCEKIEPSQQTTDANVRVMNCYASRRCQMRSLVHNGCEEASSDTEPAPQITCPTDVSFVQAVQTKEKDIVATLCSTL